MKKNLEDWLSWQESLHISEIDLGLVRIGKVAKRLNLLSPTFPIITVAGTNGKGSTVAFLESILRAEGYKTGAYTSPHLVKYNERILLNGKQATDELIIQAFEAINEARLSNHPKNEAISLTYFEFSALAAMLIYQQQKVDVAILEVGLGGRLDATNLWDTSLAIITSIGVDHIDWLGDDRERIAIEKAGIMRKNTPAISGDLDPPSTIKSEASRIGAQLQQINSEFSFKVNQTNDNTWLWKNQETSLNLSLPKMQGAFQLNNAASAITGLQSIKSLLPVSLDSIEEGLQKAQVTGRLQTILKDPDWLIDVAHNPHAAKELAKYLNQNKKILNQKQGKTLALFSMLRDKEMNEVLTIMDSSIDEWHIFPTQGPRGLTLQELEENFTKYNNSSNNKKITEQDNKQTTQINSISHESFKEAYMTVKNIMKDEDRVVAFGSFLVISEILNIINK